MNYEICKRCGKMFQKSGKTYCKSCFEKNEKEYQLITEYLQKHPNAIVLDIIGETGVSLKSINSFVEEGAISYVENKWLAEDMDKKSKVGEKTPIKRSKFHLTR